MDNLGIRQLRSVQRLHKKLNSFQFKETHQKNKDIKIKFVVQGNLHPITERKRKFNKRTRKYSFVDVIVDYKFIADPIGQIRLDHLK